MTADPRAFAGSAVTAKRLGWDDPPDGRVTDRDEFDPPAWRDEGLSPDVAGVLEVEELTVAGVAATVYMVGGDAADPATIRPAAAAD